MGQEEMNEHPSIVFFCMSVPSHMLLCVLYYDDPLPTVFVYPFDESTELIYCSYKLAS